MKIIVTNFFEKQFNKIVKDLSLDDLISKIKLESKNFVNLSTPYFKIKLNSSNKKYRLILSYDKGNVIFLFINIFDKNDKRYGENINWKIHKNEIITWRNKNIVCIKNWKYKNKFI